MPITRPPYSPGFRRQIVDLVRAGRHPDELAKEFEPTAGSIRKWVALADKQEGHRGKEGDAPIPNGDDRLNPGNTRLWRSASAAKKLACARPWAR